MAQTGTIEGALADKDAGGGPLPFANVLIKGTSKGTTTDFDGNYTIPNVEPGTYVLEFSFVGYETKDVPNVIVTAGEITRVNTDLGASAAALEEVFITATVKQETETALLLSQKKAVTQVAAIGAEELSKQAVSDAAGATTKLAGVSKTEGSGDVFVRGLGDRYLSTTLNGLPVPSDDIEKKNIDLALFSTRLIENISISKTYAANQSADQASGNVDVTSKELSGSEEFAVSVSSSLNSNVANDAFDNFKVSPEFEDVTAGIYVNSLGAGVNTFSENQTWNPSTTGTPIDRSLAVTYGRKIGDRLKVLATVGQSTDHKYRNAVFREFRENFIDDSIPDAIQWNKTITTSGLLTAKYKLNDENSDDIKLTQLVVSKVADQVFEGGRAGTATIFEETDEGEAFQFIRDQNLKKTLLSVTQLSGKNSFSDNNTLDWALGYNYVSADEPNRVRNELNFNFTEPGQEDLIQFGTTGGFQQRKSVQRITDNEFNGRIADEIIFTDEEDKLIQLTVGANFRNKNRDFTSQFFGLEELTLNTVTPSSIDNISEVLTAANVDNGLLQFNILPADLYEGKLTSYAGFADFVGRFDKFTLGLGVRYQADDINVDFDVNNFAGRTGTANKNYNRLYPALNLKYELNDKHAFRLSSSYTTTLPEFKEIAPFEYVSALGQITRGNPDLEASTDINVDLKWEFFPTRDQLFSVTGFYKDIADPISKGIQRGSAGIFSYFNAGEKAEVIGLEAEARVNIIASNTDGEVATPSLRLNVNASRMWHTQDLKEIRNDDGTLARTFRYKDLTETGLQGASDWIVNAALNYSNEAEFPFVATASLNYASDRIFALGSPRSQANNDIFYNDNIVENGFVTLDFIASKELNEFWKIGLTARNILNPEIKRTQLVKPGTNGVETNETVLSYTRGAQLGLNIKYSF